MIKTLTCSIFFTLLLANCYSQPKPSMLSNSFDSIANKFDKQRRVLWRNKNFEYAIVLMKGFYSDYSELDSITKKRYKGNIETLFYNLSCAYSLLDQKDSSINYLQVAIDNGFSFLPLSFLSIFLICYIFRHDYIIRYNYGILQL